MFFTCGSMAFEPFIYFWKCGSSWHLCNNVQIQYHSSLTDTSVPSQYGQKCRGPSLWWRGQRAGSGDHQPRCSDTCWFPVIDDWFHHLSAYLPAKKNLPTKPILIWAPTCPWLSWSEGHSSPPPSPSSCPAGCLLPASTCSTLLTNRVFLFKLV